MISIEQLYSLGFLALSAAIGLAGWPRRLRTAGLGCGVFALLLSVILGGLVATVGGSWFALGQKLSLIASDVQAYHCWGYVLLQAAVILIRMLVDTLAVVGHQAFPGLPFNLGVTLVFLALYLVLKTALLLLVWLGYGIARLLLGEDGVDNQPTALSAGAALLRPIINGLLVALTPLLAALPYLMPLHPNLEIHFSINILFWAGLWIMLLELRQWLRDGSAIPSIGSIQSGKP